MRQSLSSVLPSLFVLRSGSSSVIRPPSSVFPSPSHVILNIPRPSPRPLKQSLLCAHRLGCDHLSRRLSESGLGACAAAPADARALFDLAPHFHLHSFAECDLSFTEPASRLD